MPKKSGRDMVKLRYTGELRATYMDEKGLHKVKPGGEVDFTPDMAKFHLAESCWVAVAKGGESNA